MAAPLFAIENNDVRNLFLNPRDHLEQLSNDIQSLDTYAKISLVAFGALAVVLLFTVGYFASGLVPIVLFGATCLIPHFHTSCYLRQKENIIAARNRLGAETAIADEIDRLIDLDVKALQSELMTLGLPQSTFEVAIDARVRQVIPLIARAKYYDAIARERLDAIRATFFTPSNYAAYQADNTTPLTYQGHLERYHTEEERTVALNNLNNLDLRWYQMENTHIGARLTSTFISYVAESYLNGNDTPTIPQLINCMGDHVESYAYQHQTTPKFLVAHEAPIFRHPETNDLFRRKSYVTESYKAITGVINQLFQSIPKFSESEGAPIYITPEDNGRIKPVIQGKLEGSWKNLDLHDLYQEALTDPVFQPYIRQHLHRSMKAYFPPLRASEEKKSG